MRSFDRGPLLLVCFVLLASAPVTRPAWAQRPAGRGQPPPPPPGFTPDTIVAPHVDEPLIPFVPTGLTSAQAAKRAVDTSFTSKAAEDLENALAQRRKGAKLDYLPAVTGTARYTRLSVLTPPAGSTQGLSTDAPAGTLNPPTVAVASDSFPVFFDNFLIQGDLTVPISDYFFKLKQALTAATDSQEAAHFDVQTARALASFTARQSYFDWLRSKGQLAIAEQTMALAQAHANDSKLLFAAGSVTGADVLRAESVVAASELAVQRARSRASTTEWALRIVIHDEKVALEPGETLDGELAPVTKEMRALIDEAFLTRPELKSATKNAEASQKLAEVARADRIPALSAFAQGIVANPNARKFPAQNTFFPSWSAGVQIIWSPKRFLAGSPAGDELDQRTAAIEAQRNANRDTITREVVTAMNAVTEADAGLRTTIHQLDNAREAHRVSRQLYTAGRTTGTALLDAEFALAQARFDHLNARVDARVARVQLEHAVGRDIPAP